MPYLDHAATTPVRRSVREAVAEVLAGPAGNPSSLHGAGRAARRLVEESREQVAEAVGARPSEVVFTSGGTEADNLALLGTLAARRREDPRRRRLVAGATEHHAVLDTLEALERDDDAEVTLVAPGPDGVVTPQAVEAAIASDPGSVAVVSLMWANNEIGVVQDVAAVATALRPYGVPLHTDAVQAVGHVPVDFAGSGADLLALTGHKLGALVGTGALLVRRDATIAPVTHGGGQERGLRSGTLDVAGVRALAVAVTEAVAEREHEAVRLAALRDRLVEGAMALDPSIRPGGHWERGDVVHRLPGNAHLLVPGCEGDSLLYLLDAAGVECSTGSACRAGVPQPSHVLLAMGLPEAQARGALRLTLGHTSTDADVDAVLAALPAALERARRAAGTAGAA
ncbi:cysteine desulfurase family protein [Lapillicoccus jejuensis]|uniref:Cysteine desulfurase n=1 Tax=Lapillicoccus jejuensis TaxID=402171 RepID=A0A542E2Y6_9MICO|nr:cysteine desulfurase family protein [Lapillicoccus jejuensis]TQJ09695.1 cysteine desulfurase [Lapillicoccus jejuensis]